MFDGIDESLWVFGVDFDVEYVDVGEVFEQYIFVFYYWFGGQWVEVIQVENCGVVGNYCYQVVFVGVLVGQFGIVGDFMYWFGDIWVVGQGQVLGGSGGFGQFDIQFFWMGLCVIFEGSGFKIGYLGIFVLLFVGQMG